MDYEQGKKMLDSHCCSQCESPLTLVWDAKTSNHDLVCGSNRSHKGYKPAPSVTQEIARGRGDKVVGKEGKDKLEDQLNQRQHPLSLLPTKDIATSAELTKEKTQALVTWGESLELKPYLGHVCLYRGKPYVTIDGYYYLLNKKGQELRVGTRPLTEQERKNAIIPSGAHAWAAEAWLGETRIPSSGLGIVTQEEIEGKSERNTEQFRAPVVHDHPQRMAEKRAEWQLLRKLVPLGGE